MHLTGLMPWRNENWIGGFSARVALKWCDDLVILDHASTEPRTVLEGLSREFGKRIHWLSQDGGWDEMRHRTTMLDVARSNGATHVAITDADEVLTANLLGSIRTIVERAHASQILMIPLYNLRDGVARYHADGVWGSRVASVAFVASPELHWTGDTFHKRVPDGGRFLSQTPTVQQGHGGILHFWGASLDRLRAKHRLYRCVERCRYPNKVIHEIERDYSMAEHGRPWLGERASYWTFSDVPADWIEPYRGLMEEYFSIDSPPWQDAECERLIAEYGRQYFNGLKV